MSRKAKIIFVLLALIAGIFEYNKGGVFVYRHYDRDGILICRAIARDTWFKCEKVKYEQDR